MNKNVIMHKLKHTGKRIASSAKWVVFSIITGLIVGLAATFLSLCLTVSGIVFTQEKWVIWLLPVGGLAITALYHLLKDDDDHGTNLVISAIHSGDKLPFAMAPLVFVATAISHLLGASVGQEGAALQLGGCLGNGIGKIFHFDEKDRNTMIMCGMSAAFSALFGTPMAAAIFPMEMISVGVMYYSALVPCVISALIANTVAEFFGFNGFSYMLSAVPMFRIGSAVKVSILAVLCAVLSILYCVALHQSESLFNRFIKNRYLRIFAGGCLMIVCTLLIGSPTYNLSGTDLISVAIGGNAAPEAFILKLLVTAICIGAGYKGGEIMPAMAVGATFGCVFGTMIGFSPALCAAIGITAMFCGVTNCPISSLLIAFELFGFSGMPYFLLTIAFSYMLSGYFGLYRSQRIVYSKYKNNYINKTTE